MVGQEAHGWWGYAENSVATWEMTVQVDKRDTFAEVALTAWMVMGEAPSGYFGIVKMVSDSGTETFLSDGTWGMKSYRQAVFRTRVTSVRVQLAAWDGWVRGRLFLNFWS
jgi:hypothetical protein